MNSLAIAARTRRPEDYVSAPLDSGAAGASRPQYTLFIVSSHLAIFALRNGAAPRAPPMPLTTITHYKRSTAGTYSRSDCHMRILYKRILRVTFE